MSYYSVAGNKFMFQSFSPAQDSESLSLSVTIYQAGVTQFNIILNCPLMKRYFKINCAVSQCQLDVTPKAEFDSVKVQIPLYPSESPRVQNYIDGSLTYYKGENLVFDLLLNDIYGNIITSTVDESVFSASFKFGPGKTNLTEFQFEKTFFQGKVSFTLNDLDNSMFINLPPRSGMNYYSIDLQYTTSDGRSFEQNIPVKLVSTDWTLPFNFIVPRFDPPEIDSTLSTVQYDSMIQADLPGRIYITLRNSNFQQKNEWAQDLTDLQINFFSGTF
jgi:hypothetical protein